MNAEARAVVIGASITGLFAAAALSEHVGEVLIIERDELPDDARTRRGVPQGKHVHLTMPIGYQTGEELLPGLHARVDAAGAPTIDFGRDLAAWGGAGWLARAGSELHMTTFTRPLFERAVRDLLLERENVVVRHDAVTGLLTTSDRARVEGVALKSGATERADLVIDASGRGSNSTKWLADLGFEAPREQQVKTHVGYTSALIRVPDGTMPDGTRGITALPHAPATFRGAGFLPVEDGTHIFTAVGVVGHYAPTDREGFLDFVRQAPTPLLAEVLEASEFITDLSGYLIPSNRRREWSELNPRPEGFLVLGDAVGAYNPSYGQGMTQAILAAEELRQEVVARDGDIADIAHAVQERLAPVTEAAFVQAASGDSFYPDVEIENFTPPPPEAMAPFADLGTLATQDPEVAQALFRMSFFLDHETIMSQPIQDRVAAWIAEGRPMHRNTDPAEYPAIMALDAAV